MNENIELHKLKEGLLEEINVYYTGYTSNHTRILGSRVFNETTKEFVGLLSINNSGIYQIEQNTLQLHSFTKKYDLRN